MRSRMMSEIARERREAVLLGVLTAIQVDSSDDHLERNYRHNELGSTKMKSMAHPRSTWHQNALYDYT